jgi:hypothetical protein
MFTGFVDDADLPLAFIVCIEDGGYGRKVCIPVISKVLEACIELRDSLLIVMNGIPPAYFGAGGVFVVSKKSIGRGMLVLFWTGAAGGDLL